MKEAMNRELTHTEKGKLRWARLKELDHSGELSFVKSRRELATAAGYSEKEQITKGISWIYRLIKNGCVTETLLGFNNDTKTPEYEYHLTGKEPVYERGRPKASPEDDTEKPQRIWLTKEEAEQLPQIPSIILDDSAIKATISKGDISITVELKNSKQAGEFIKEILRGE